jgi:putative addiction module component (TIGR02574 family)
MEDREARDYSELSVEEKIVHVQDLWDEIAKSVDELPLTEAQAAELARRLKAHQDDPGDYTTWPELRRRLQGQC